MKNKIYPLLLFCSLPLSLFAQTEKKSMSYPVSKKVDQSDKYFNTIVQDPYRWLENDKGEDVANWVTEQNKVTTTYLNRIPFRAAVKNRITELVNYPKYGSPSKVGEYYIYSKNDGLQNQSIFYYQKGLDGTEQVFLDPNKLSADGTAAVTLLGVSKDKKYIAYAINLSGSDWQTIHVMEIAGAKKLSDELNWVKFSGAAWAGDGFYYSRYQQPIDGKELSGKNEDHEVWYHKIGTAQAEDKLIYKDADHPLRYYGAQTTEDERYLIISKSEGTYGSELMYQDLYIQGSKLEYLTHGFKNDYAVLDNDGKDLLVLTDADAPNKCIVKIDPASSGKQNWKTVIAEKKQLLENAATAGHQLFCTYLQDVSSHVYQHTFQGELVREIKLPGIGAAAGFGGYKDDTELFYTFTSFTFPSTIYKYNIASGKSDVFRQPEVKFNPADYTTEQIFYPSKDGTKIPMFITCKKGLLKNGSNPTLLYAYGGFNINLTPAFSSVLIAWLEKGGIDVQANLRGGGEYGEEWHSAGMLMKKQNVFDDFIAAAEYLINSKYTSSSKLAIMGGSNGGLLVGAVSNQRPDLFKVAIPQVGVMDMLRYHKFTVGWGWAVEYGSSDSLPFFNYIYKYSPLHNIKPKSYPATLVTTADHDDRVVPAHSFKYIATLQENQKGNNPVLIRVDVKAGHGAGKPLSKQIEEMADIYSFAWYNMGFNPDYQMK